MWFLISDYPKFVDAYVEAGLQSANWTETFYGMGFKTYVAGSFTNNKHHWLDEHEFTWFLLRYS